MELNNSSLENILSRLSSAIENMEGGRLEQVGVSYTLSQLLDTTIENRASLLHVCVGSPPLLRINEQLIPIGSQCLTRDDCRRILVPILNPEMRTELYDGNEVETYIPFRDTGFKTNIYLERGNLGASIRRLRSDIPSLDSLLFTGPLIDQALNASSGLVLLTGSPRCGKLNTLAAIVAHLGRHRNARIVSLEKPIQFWQQNSTGVIVQREVGTDTQSFARGIQQAVLQDTDIIALTDIPDRETAEYALRAAAGGHLVLASLDGSSAVRALERLVNTFANDNVAPKALSMLSNVLRLVACQTLVHPTNSRNAIPVFELLDNNNEVSEELVCGRVDRLRSIMEYSRMQTLEKELNALVKAGTITREEALKHVDALYDDVPQPATSDVPPVATSESENSESPLTLDSITNSEEMPLMAWL